MLRVLCSARVSGQAARKLLGAAGKGCMYRRAVCVQGASRAGGDSCEPEVVGRVLDCAESAEKHARNQRDVAWAWHTTHSLNTPGVEIPSRQFC